MARGIKGETSTGALNLTTSSSVLVVRLSSVDGVWDTKMQARTRLS